MNARRIGREGAVALVFLGAALAAAAYGFRANRIFFWFPDLILRAALQTFFVDRPRYAFLAFQVPGVVLSLSSSLSLEVFRLKYLFLNAGLSFHGVAAMAVCCLLLLRQGRGRLIPYPFIAYGMLFQYADLAAFGGALHGFSFFWMLMCLRPERGRPGFVQDCAYTAVFILFIFSYEPFSFLGCIPLLLLALRDRLPYQRALSSLGLIVSGWAILVQRSYFQKPYSEAIWSAEKIFPTPHTVSVLLIILASALIPLAARGSSRAKSAVRVLPVLAVAILAGAYAAFWRPSFGTSVHFDYRVCVPIGSTALALAMILADSIRDGGDRRGWEPALWLLAAFSLALGTYRDVSVSRRMSRGTQSLAEQARGAQEKCFSPRRDPDNAVYREDDYPFVAIFNPDLFAGKVPLPSAGLHDHLTRDIAPAIARYCESGAPPDIKALTAELLQEFSRRNWRTADDWPLTKKNKPRS